MDCEINRIEAHTVRKRRGQGVRRGGQSRGELCLIVGRQKMGEDVGFGRLKIKGSQSGYKLELRCDKIVKTSDPVRLVRGSWNHTNAREESVAIFWASLLSALLPGLFAQYIML